MKDEQERRNPSEQHERKNTDRKETTERKERKHIVTERNYRKKRNTYTCSTG